MIFRVLSVQSIVIFPEVNSFCWLSVLRNVVFSCCVHSRAYVGRYKLYSILLQRSLMISIYKFIGQRGLFAIFVAILDAIERGSLRCNSLLRLADGRETTRARRCGQRLTTWKKEDHLDPVDSLASLALSNHLSLVHLAVIRFAVIICPGRSKALRGSTVGGEKLQNGTVIKTQRNANHLLITRLLYHCSFH